MIAEGSVEPDQVRAKLLALDGESQLWPDDAAFADAWEHNQLYQGASTRKVRAVLEALEIGMRSYKQEFLPKLETLSVEHFLPQKAEAGDYPLAFDTSEARNGRAKKGHPQHR